MRNLPGWLPACTKQTLSTITHHSFPLIPMKTSFGPLESGQENACTWEWAKTMPLWQSWYVKTVWEMIVVPDWFPGYIQRVITSHLLAIAQSNFPEYDQPLRKWLFLSHHGPQIPLDYLYIREVITSCKDSNFLRSFSNLAVLTFEEVSISANCFHRQHHYLFVLQMVLCSWPSLCCTCRYMYICTYICMYMTQ